MSNANPALTARKTQARSRVSNGQDLLPGIDGRSPMARRYRDIAAALISDNSGIAHCAEARVQLIRRFSAACVMAEAMEAKLVMGEPIDVAEHSLLASTLVRLAQRIGIDRRARDIVPDLKDYLAARSEEKAAAADITIDNDELDDDGDTS
jgi:hypothetical protein